MAADERRKFLIVLNSLKAKDIIQAKIEKRFPGSLVFHAQDGIEAAHKLANDPPCVLIIEQNLNKKSGREVVANMCKNSKFAQTAVVFLTPIHEEEHLVDEVVVGRVQYLAKFNDDALFNKALNKALNFSSHGGKGEFFLRYLSKGEYLMRKGEKADFVYIVKLGQLRAQIGSEDKITTLGLIEAGEFVGEMAYINGEPRICDVVSTTDCELIEVPVDHLDHLLFQKPAWSRALLKTLSKRVKLAAEREAKLHNK